MPERSHRPSVDRFANALTVPPLPDRPRGPNRLRDAQLLLVCVLLAALVGRHHAHSAHHIRGAPSPVSRGAPLAAPLLWSAGLAAPVFRVPLPRIATQAVIALSRPTPKTLPAAAKSCVATAPPAAARPAAPSATAAAATRATIAADLPGLYGAPWVASVHGELIAALNVTVPRNPAQAPTPPVVQIYRQGARTPIFSAAVPVSVSRGPDALIYRMFVNGPIRCIDLTIHNGAGYGKAHLYYPDHGRLFEADGVFTVQH
jgi:hypothetical protein